MYLVLLVLRMGWWMQWLKSLPLPPYRAVLQSCNTKVLIGTIADDEACACCCQHAVMLRLLWQARPVAGALPRVLSSAPS